VTRRSQRRTPPDGERPSRTRHVLVAVPIGVVAALLLWIGDMNLTHRDWATGGVVFGLGLLCVGLAVNQLRRAGLVR
jgi:hypothetical protein